MLDAVASVFLSQIMMLVDYWIALLPLEYLTVVFSLISLLPVMLSFEIRELKNLLNNFILLQTILHTLIPLFQSVLLRSATFFLFF